MKIKLQQKSRERKSSSLFVNEGLQENRLALDSGFVPKKFYLSEGIYDYSLKLPDAEIYTVADSLFEKIAYRGTTGGIIGIYESPKFSLEQIELSDNPLIVILKLYILPLTVDQPKLRTYFVYFLILFLNLLNSFFTS